MKMFAQIKILACSASVSLALGCCCAADAQSTGQYSALSNSISTPRPFDPSSNTTNPSALAVQSQNPYLGSVQAVPLVPGVLSLSLEEAVQYALKANLGLVDTEQEHAQSRAGRMRALSFLLPHLSAEAVQDFRNFPVNTIGGQKLDLPNIIPTFSYQSAHLELRQNVIDMSAIEDLRAARAEEQASSEALNDARNVVVLAATSAYISVAASQSRVKAAEAQLQSAEALDSLITDRVRREVSPEIDAIRARVTRQTSEQRLTLARIRLEKDKLALTRIIGLAVEQEFVLSNPLPSTTASVGESLTELVDEATSKRADLKAAQARVKAASLQTSAASAQRLPSLEVHAAAGGTGVNTGKFYGDYEVEGRVSLPIFTGRRIESDVLSKQAVLRRRQAELEDLRTRVKYDVRSALLDLEAADKSVEVAKQNLDLAYEGMKQTRDRFNAGVTNSLELIQAQQAVAEADDNSIASLYADNLAKLMLLRSTGTAEQKYAYYLGVK